MNSNTVMALAAQRMDALFSMDSQPPAAADSSHVRQDTSMTQQDVLGRGDTQQEVRQDTAMTQQETTQVDNDSMIEDSQPTAAAVPASPQQPTSVLPHLRSIVSSCHHYTTQLVAATITLISLCRPPQC